MSDLPWPRNDLQGKQPLTLVYVCHSSWMYERGEVKHKQWTMNMLHEQDDVTVAMKWLKWGACGSEGVKDECM